MFKNMMVYRLDKDWDMATEKLEEALKEKLFQPCGGLQMSSAGWVPPLQGGRLVHEVGGHWLLALCVEKRLLPGSVVKRKVKERCDEILKKEGRKASRKEVKEIKEQVIDELLPQAFTDQKITRVWLDPRGGWLGVDASSPAKGDEVMESLVDCLTDPPIRLIQTNLSPAAAMSRWLADGEAPSGFTIDRDCELRSSDEDKATVKYARHSLDGEDVRDHLAAGKQPASLALTWNDRVSFALTDKGQVKRIGFLDVVLEGAADGAESEEEIFGAEFAITAGEFSELLPDLMEALGGEAEAA